jgi:type IV pilus assembly protein PilV
MTNNTSGFTLVEFLVAMVILMVGLLGMLQGINLAISMNLESVLRNEAVSVADELMMKTRANTYSNVNTIPWESMPTEFTNRQIRGVFKHYSVQQVVFTRTSSATTPSRSKEIIVDVRWRYKNKSGTHSVSSVVSKSE